MNIYFEKIESAILENIPIHVLLAMLKDEKNKKIKEAIKREIIRR